MPESPFNAEQLAVLESKLETWNANHKGDRKEILAEAEKAVRLLMTTEKPMERKALSNVCIPLCDSAHRIYNWHQAVKNWYWNRTQGKDKALRKWDRAWTGKDAWWAENKALINGATEEETGEAPGGPGFIGKVQTVAARLWSELASDEVEEWNEKAELWQKEGPPRDVQIR